MSNKHSEIADSQIHVAKGFASGLAGTLPWRNERGQQVFENVGIFPKAISTADSSAVPATEVDGDIYLLGNERGIMDVDTINWQSANTVRYSFNGSPALVGWQTGDYITFVDATNSLHNGTFVITAKDGPNSWIEVENLLISDATNDEATDSPCTGTSTKAEWDGCKQNSWARYNEIDDKWYSCDPVAGTICFNVAKGAFYIFDNYWQNIVIKHNDLATNSTTAVTTKETLKTYTLPANTITKDGQRLKVRAVYANGGNVNSKYSAIELFGQVCSKTSIVSSDRFIFEICIERKSSSLCLITGSVLGSGTVFYFHDNSVDWTIDNSILAVGQNAVATAGDINNVQLEIETIK